MKTIITIFIVSSIMLFITLIKSTSNNNTKGQYLRVIEENRFFLIKDKYSNKAKIYNNTGTKISSIPLKTNYHQKIAIDDKNRIHILTIYDRSFEVEIFNVYGKKMKSENFLSNNKLINKFPTIFDSIIFKDEGFETFELYISSGVRYRNNSTIISFKKSISEIIFESMILPFIFLIVYITCFIILIFKSKKFRDFVLYHGTWNLHWGFKKRK